MDPIQEQNFWRNRVLKENWALASQFRKEFVGPTSADGSSVISGTGVGSVSNCGNSSNVSSIRTSRLQSELENERRHRLHLEHEISELKAVMRVAGLLPDSDSVVSSTSK